MIEQSCPTCGKLLQIPDEYAGKKGRCTKCGATILVHESSRSSAEECQVPSFDLMENLFCPKCGEKNLGNNFKCIRCGFVLHGPSQAQYIVTDDNTMGGLIPYKNKWGLLAYYVGIFSLFPFIGIPLGVAAVCFGIKGLSLAKRQPEVKGKIHAWVGIVLGTLCAGGYGLLAAIFVLAACGMFG